VLLSVAESAEITCVCDVITHKLLFSHLADRHSEFTTAGVGAIRTPKDE